MFVGRHTMNSASPGWHTSFLGRSRPILAGPVQQNLPGLAADESRLGRCGVHPAWAGFSHSGRAGSFSSGWAGSSRSLAGPSRRLCLSSVGLPRLLPGPAALACPGLSWQAAGPRLGCNAGVAAKPARPPSSPAGPRYSRPPWPCPELPWAAPRQDVQVPGHASGDPVTSTGVPAAAASRKSAKYQ
jgi:hypothetical protein